MCVYIHVCMCVYIFTYMSEVNVIIVRLSSFYLQCHPPVCIYDLYVYHIPAVHIMIYICFSFTSMSMSYHTPFIIWYERSIYLYYLMFVNFTNPRDIILLHLYTWRVELLYYISYILTYMLSLTIDLLCIICGNTHDTESGGRLNKKDGLTRYVDPMLKIRRPNGRLIFNMEIAIHR